MKNSNFFVSLLWLISFESSAQPILTSSDYVNFPSSIGYAITNISSLNPGNSGANAYWDFSNIQFSPEAFYTVSVVPINSAPFFNSFPTANYCTKLYLLSGDYESYSLSNLDQFGIETLGVTTPDAIQYDYSPNTPFTSLPRIFNSTNIDTYQSTTDLTPLTSTSTYDSYGTLVMPFGTFNDVIRIKTVTDTRTSYSWIKTNPLQQLLVGDFNTNLYLLQNGLLGVENNIKKNEITIYPNPSDGEFTISSSLNLSEIKIIDILGKELLVITPTGLSTKIKLSTYKKGVYFVKLISNNMESVKKIVVK